MVVTTLSTPSGSPASARTPASASIVSGVWLAGLTTIVQPAAIAGPILRVPIASGKFHGVMKRQGPTGFLMVSSRLPPAGACIQRPWMRTASSAYQRKNSTPYPTSPRASATVLPISRLIRCANSSARSVIRLKAVRRISPRSRGGVLAQARLGGDGGVEGVDGVVDRAVRDVGEHRAVGGIDHVEPLAALRLTPHAADEETPLVGAEKVESVHVPASHPEACLPSIGVRPPVLLANR